MSRNSLHMSLLTYMGSFIGKMFFLSRHVFFVLCEETSTWIDLFHLKVDLIQINSSRFESSQFELNRINSNWIDLTIRILPIPSWQGVFLWHSDITKSNKCWLVVTWIQEQDPSTLVFFFETKEWHLTLGFNIFLICILSNDLLGDCF